MRKKGKKNEDKCAQRKIVKAAATARERKSHCRYLSLSCQRNFQTISTCPPLPPLPPLHQSTGSLFPVALFLFLLFLFPVGVARDSLGATLRCTGTFRSFSASFLLFLLLFLFL